jgi:hypothetical protein
MGDRAMRGCASVTTHDRDQNPSNPFAKMLFAGQ